MPSIKFSRVISFSSEDSVFKASNLLKNRKYLCAKPGESQLSVVLQLEQSSKISQIDIGNAGSAFVEVQVGRATAENPDHYRTILPASSFMSPLESRKEENTAKVRMFPNLNPDIAKEKWDRVKIIATQPFNKVVKYGVAFVSLMAEETTPKSPVKRLGAFTLLDEDGEVGIKPGQSLFKRECSKKEKSVKEEGAKAVRTLASLAVEDIRTPPRPLLKKLEAGKRDAPVRKKPDQKLPSRKELPGEASSSKKRKRSSPTLCGKKPKAKPKKRFNELLNGVVFSISGIQNPERGDLRKKAVEMGALYKPDWDSTCTHLICAFAGTPKFNQVKKAKGKIVKKHWLQNCHSDRKRLPWRRFCLDPKDKGDESEEEIIEDQSDENDTDDEIEAIRAMKENSSDANDSDEAYNADTDIDEDSDFPELPDFFERKVFYLFGTYKDREVKRIRRQVIAAGGTVAPYMGKSVEFVISNCDWNDDFEDVISSKSGNKVKFVRPEFVSECWRANSNLSPKEFLIRRPV